MAEKPIYKSQIGAFKGFVISENVWNKMTLKMQIRSHGIYRGVKGYQELKLSNSQQLDDLICLLLSIRREIMYCFN